MKLSLLQENFNFALGNVSRFVASKSQLPILGNILLSTDQGRLKLSASNLEIGINQWIGSKIEKEGSITVPAKEVTEFVSYLPAGKLDIGLNDQSLFFIDSPKASSTFAPIPAADFPQVPSINPASSVNFDLTLLAKSIAQVAFAAATDDTRPVLTAIYWLFTGTEFTMAATDGFRLSLKTGQFDTPIALPEGQENQKFLIPARSFIEIAKLSKGQSAIQIGLTADQHQLVFALPDLELVSRLLEGDFPDYQRIIPSTSTTTVTLDREEFAQSIKIASIFARESANVVRFKVTKNNLELTANAPQIGSNKTTVEAKVEGDSLEIAFNYKFVTDFLSAISGNQVIIKLNQSLTPGQFCDPSDPSFTHIIMPVRLQD